jgi:hypothetical protein
MSAFNHWDVAHAASPLDDDTLGRSLLFSGGLRGNSSGLRLTPSSSGNYDNSGAASLSHTLDYGKLISRGDCDVTRERKSAGKKSWRRKNQIQQPLSPHGDKAKSIR